jgi:uncharacterized protein
MAVSSKSRSATPLEAILGAADLGAFCRRWQIRALELYGSAARGELGPESDLDLLVSFGPHADWSLLDHVRMKQELAALTGRRVDLMTRRALERSANQLLRREILADVRTLYRSDEVLDVAG